VLDAEPLLLVDDHQAEPGEPGLRGEQLVRADDHVHGAVGQAGQGLIRLGLALETGQRPDLHRERGVALGERGEVLLHQQRGRHEHRDLLAVLHRLERGADRDLGLAVPDVPADQPVHRHWPFHIDLDLVDRAELVRGLHVGEGVLELALPGGIRAEGEPGRGHPGRVQPDQLRGDLPDGLARPALGLGPVGAAEAVQGRCLAAGVLGHLVQLVGRHVQPVRRLAPPARGVLDHQVLAGGARRGPRGHLHVPADAMLLVHHVVAGLELQRVDAAAPSAGHPPHVPGRGQPGRVPGQVALGEQGDLRGGPDEAVLDPGRGHVGDAGLGRLGDVLQPGADVLATQHLGQPLGRPVTLGNQHDAPALGQPVAHVGEHPAGVAAIRRRQRSIDPERAGLTWLVRRSCFGWVGAVLLRVGHPERCDRPPRQAEGGRRDADPLDRLEGRRAEINRRLSAGRRVDPGSLEELLARADQFLGAGADPLRVAGQHEAARGDVVDE
jgi:hypothetical protein